MLKAKITNDQVIRCPLCLATNFTLYRRIPKHNGWLDNLCHCKRCGQDFSYSEDKEGRPIPSED